MDAWAQDMPSPQAPAAPAATVAPAASAGSRAVPDAAALNVACRRLGYSEFRPGQQDSIQTLFARRRLLLVAPTGGGKSLCYQLPASLLPGTSLIVSPLVALMNDQVAALTRRGVPATYLASTLDAEEARRRMGELRRGAYKMVYVAPERLVFEGFRAVLQSLRVPLVAVDEAHCISEWGHDFRPEYMRIGELVASMPDSMVLACTATATPVVRDEILSRLGLPSDTPQIVRGFARPNLRLMVQDIGRAKERDGHVDALLQDTLGGPGSGRGTAILYAPTRKQTGEEVSRLQGAGWRADGYHAGLDGEVRDRVQRSFIGGELEVVVATNAFGMGIDRGDVRAVIHLAPPGSIESYYQEVGRAGRDGAPAWGLLITTGADMPLRRSLLERGTANEAPPPAPVVEHKWNLFLELMRWAEGGSCRHDAILRYFGDEGEAIGGCGHCDVCARLAGGDAEVDDEAASLVVRKALSAVARIHGRFGLTAAVQLLRGADDPRLVRCGFTRVRTFGILKEHPERWLLALLRRCVTAGWVDFVGGDRPLAVLTAAGRAVMLGERPARLLLPSAASASQAPRRAQSGGHGGGRAAGRERGAAPPPMAGAEAAAFEALRQWRMQTAQRMKVPPYVIASDRTLRDLAAMRPRNLSELQTVHGIGAARAERFGADFLAVLAAEAGGGVRAGA